jgi:hypothetical protein
MCILLRDTPAYVTKHFLLTTALCLRVLNSVYLQTGSGLVQVIQTIVISSPLAFCRGLHPSLRLKVLHVHCLSGSSGSSPLLTFARVMFLCFAPRHFAFTYSVFVMLFVRPLVRHGTSSMFVNYMHNTCFTYLSCCLYVHLIVLVRQVCS